MNSSIFLRAPGFCTLRRVKCHSPLGTGLTAQRHGFTVKAIQDPESRSREPSPVPSVDGNKLVNIKRSVNLLTNRYDFLSAGIGALGVTTWCWAHGQDPITAMWITAASTVVALLLNDTIFKE